MKKTKFIGIVNGVEFDNVKEYNNAITKAIEEGSLVNASSQTQVVDEPSSLLLGFDGSEKANAYVDKYISLNDEENANKLKELHEMLCNNYEVVLREIHNMDEHAVENYLSEVNNILQVINADILKTNTVEAKKNARIKELEAEAEEYKKDIYILNNSKNILNKWNKYYNAIAEILLSQCPAETQDKENISSACCKECGSVCCCKGDCEGECKCEEGSAPNPPKSAIEGLVNVIMEAFRDIDRQYYKNKKF